MLSILSIATLQQLLSERYKPEMIDYYLTHYQPFDKAGSYGIQEWIGAVGITQIKGSYNNVVGFPTQQFWKELTEMIASQAI